MAYKYIRFGGSQLLPQLGMSQEIGTGEARIDAIDAPRGGAFDSLGLEAATRGGYSLRVSGVIMPGIGGGATELTASFNSLRSYLGKREKLWRQAGDGTLQWAIARLVNIEAVREAIFTLQQEVSLTFYVYSALWHGEHHGGWMLDDGYALDDGLVLDTGLYYPLTETTTTIEITNGGNGILRDFFLSVAAVGSPITQAQIYRAGESHLSWSGTIAAGTSLVFDFGAMSVKNNGVNAYNGLTLTANHKIDDWLRLEPGKNTFQVIRVGGSALSTASIMFDDGWV